MMKHPTPGRKLAEARAKKGLTQQELSDRAGIDIRTLQRIEAGEVIPRPSTLLLIAGALDCDPSELTPGNDEPVMPATLLIALLAAGLLHFISWLFYGSPLPRPEFAINYNLHIAIVYMLSGVLFYYSFKVLGTYYRNGLLQVSAVVIMVLLPLFFIVNLINPAQYSFIPHVVKLVVALFGLNGFLFGAALLRTRSPYRNLYLITGIIQLLISPFYLLPFSLTWLIGNWLSLPFMVLALAVVWREYGGKG